MISAGQIRLGAFIAATLSSGCSIREDPSSPPILTVLDETPRNPSGIGIDDAFARPVSQFPLLDGGSESRGDELKCEALWGLRSLMKSEAHYFAEHDRFTEDLALLAPPGACPDGSRAVVPEGEWLAGCHFSYAVRVQGRAPDETVYFIRAVRREAAGAEFADDYVMSSDGLGLVRSWPSDLTIENCDGKRQAGMNPLDGSACEAATELRSLFIAQKSLFQERDRFSEDLIELGFWPEPCLDGTRVNSTAPHSSGCHFDYRVEVRGDPPNQRFDAVATGAGQAQGVELRLTSSFMWSPVEPECEG